MKLLPTALVALALPLLVGCGHGLVPFTQEIRDEHNLSDGDLKNLQYYISTKVTLRRELESGGKQITGSHKLVLVSGKVIEEVVLEEATPGIAVDIGPKTLAISFEPGSSLTFAPQGSRFNAVSKRGFAEPPDPFPGNRVARDPEPLPSNDGLTGNYWLTLEPRGSVTYQGKQFDVVDGGTQAFLMIDADTLNRVDKSRKVLPGMRLTNK